MDIARLQPGQPIGPFVREGTFMHWNRFAGVNDEFAGHHMDDEVGRFEGFPSAFGMAPLMFSYLQAMLRDWLADAGRIDTLNIRLRSPFLRGRTFNARGEVRALRQGEGERLVDVEIRVEDDQGTLLIQGEATLALPAG
ncbi:MAG: hypothetical protein AB7Q97_22445 [Gammaproteobacteria bacterium]